MGAAAEHRGNALIRLEAGRGIDARRIQEDEVRAIEIAEDCNAFSRQAMEYLVEPRGLRQNTIERARVRRGWKKRHMAVISAHNVWVDADSRNAMAYHGACVRRAKAIHELFKFALGCWTIPNHIQVPRAAT